MDAEDTNVETDSYVYESGVSGRTELEKALENACETLSAIATNVLDFSYDNQDLLYAKVNEFVRDLAHLDAQAGLEEAAVPIEVLEAIDRGRNPEHCTYQLLEACAESNNATKGKLECLQSFRDVFVKAANESGVQLASDAEIADAIAPRDMNTSENSATVHDQMRDDAKAS